ncbi:hypothetical protein HKD37_04G010842 [Glycine soja]|uniref:Uncharacterized protein n=1 Tax=Glycine soja TaxID=3848 RepID=A0A445L0U0_GLYSO|nr:hypothetical protein GmHk_04G010930 [Glycine max]RZC16757.1 hypothetical protein D0Y65_009881 [Glycine soja]
MKYGTFVVSVPNCPDHISDGNNPHIIQLWGTSSGGKREHMQYGTSVKISVKLMFQPSPNCLGKGAIKKQAIKGIQGLQIIFAQGIALLAKYRKSKACLKLKVLESEGFQTGKSLVGTKGMAVFCISVAKIGAFWTNQEGKFQRFFEMKLATKA